MLPKTISDLPTEILHVIFVELKQSSEGVKALKQCARVCHQWAEITLPIVWQAPTLNKRNHLDACIEIVQKSRNNQTVKPYHWFVHELAFGSRLSRHLTDQKLNDIVSACGQTLKCIILSDSNPLTSVSLQSISQHCPNLLKLSISEVTDTPKYSSEGLIQLFSSCRNLIDVNIWTCSRFNDEVLMELTRSCSHLQNLVLYECGELTEQGLASLEKSARLKYVYIKNRYLTESPVLYQLAQRCRRVKILTITESREQIEIKQQFNLIKELSFGDISIER